MSLRVLSEVWWHAQVSGNELLVLLALADNADEETREAWPGFGYLARKTRLSERSIQRIVLSLEAANQLAIKRTPGQVNRYKIPTQDILSGVTQLRPATQDTAMSSEPSVSVNRILKGERGRKPKTPLPADLALTAEDRVFAAEQGCRDPDLGFRCFQEWARETDARRAMWHATLRKWFLNHRRYGCPCQGPASGHRRVEQRAPYEGYKRSRDTGALGLSGGFRSMP